MSEPTSDEIPAQGYYLDIRSDDGEVYPAEHELVDPDTPGGDEALAEADHPAGGDEPGARSGYYG